jgi:hypothetical protein
MHLIIIENAKYSLSGAQFYDELVVWALVPKIAGSNRAEAVGFLGRKTPQRAFLRRGSKAICPMSPDLQHVKDPCDLRGSRNRKPN